MPLRPPLIAGLAGLAVLLLALALVLGPGAGDDDSAPVTLDPGAAAQERALSRIATGPAGSAPVRLVRWRYRADPADRGRADGWRTGDWDGRAVDVPFSPNAGAIAGAAGRRAYAGGVGWYAREIDVPAPGAYELRFESAHHRAQVFVDGVEVRRHTGAYEPFTARPDLARGRHTVAVRVDWRAPERQAQEGYARGWFNHGGLNRPVTLARLGASEIGAVAVRTRLLGDGRARVDVSARVRNRAAGPVRSLDVRGSLTRGATRVPLDFGTVKVSPDRSKPVRATAVLDDPDLWAPGSPSRYELRIAVPTEALVRRRVGLRELGWGPDGLRLNGRPLVLHGAALPPDAQGRGDALDAVAERRIVDQLRAAGANATRSQMPLASSLLTRLDAAGILVWQEIGPWEPAGAWRADTPAGIARARDRALRTAETQQPHAAILAWTLTNEVAGSGQPEQAEYVARTARALRELDPTRPVAADLWGSRLTRTGGPLFAELDAIGITDYVGWYDGLDAGSDGQAALAAERVARMRALFGDKVLVVTELGAAGTDRVAAGAFGGRRFQADLLARRIRALRELPGVSGVIVWGLRDYALRPDFRGGSVLLDRPGLRLRPGLNEKGLFDYAGRPKPALDAVRRAFGG